MPIAIPGYLIADFFRFAQLLRLRPLGPLCFRDARRYLLEQRVPDEDLLTLRHLHTLVLRCTGQGPAWGERIAVWAMAVRPGSSQQRANSAGAR